MDELRFLLNDLIEHYPSMPVKETIETLLKIHRNILNDLENDVYRTIRTANPAFYKKVWIIPPARQFMLKCGWMEVDSPVGNTLVFESDEQLNCIIKILVDYRFVSPEAAEWDNENKIQNLNVSQLREEQLRRKAAIQRQKELEEFKKDKLEREQLARIVKAEIAGDKVRRMQSDTTVNQKIERPVRKQNRHSDIHHLSSSSYPGKRLGTE